LIEYKWRYNIIKQYIDKGLTVSQMAEKIGLSRQRIYIIIKATGLKDQYDKKQTLLKEIRQKPNKCKYCGCEISYTRKVCDECYNLREKNCINCGRNLEDKQQHRGMCNTCYGISKQKTVECVICGVTSGNAGYGACSKCFIRTWMRVKKGTTPDKWRNHKTEADMELYKKMKRVDKRG